MSKENLAEDEDFIEDEEALEDEDTEEDAEDEESEESDAEESAEEEASEEDSEELESDEVVVTIGDAPVPEEEEAQKAPEWVRELRKQNRELQKELRELRAKEQSAPKPQAKLGPKPKLEDYDYDSEAYEAALEKWYDQKRVADAQNREAEAEQKKQQEAWQARLDQYNKAKSELKVKDFDEAEAVLLEMFDQTQQGIVVQGADNSAVVFYALGKNPERAKELAQIKDPVQFAFAVAKLEKDLKVTSRKAPPPPEKKVAKGSASVSGAVDSTLERLRAEARKTGDFSKVTAYRRKQAAKK